MIKNTPIDSIDSALSENKKWQLIDMDVFQSNRLIMGLENDPRADVFRVLRTKVLKRLRQNNWNSFAITSTNPSAGKTFTSINLAIAIAIAMEENQNVLLVDADLRRPSIGQCLELQYQYGFVDCIKKDLSLDEVYICPGIKHLFILPGKKPEINSSELIASQKMTKLINEFKSRFKSGIVIFDLPPLSVVDDVMLFMPHFDAALLVVEDGKNSSEELQHAMLILEETNLLGLVVNKSTQELPIYRYGYGYGY